MTRTRPPIALGGRFLANLARTVPEVPWGRVTCEGTGREREFPLGTCPSVMPPPHQKRWCQYASSITIMTRSSPRPRPRPQRHAVRVRWSGCERSPTVPPCLHEPTEHTAQEERTEAHPSSFPPPSRERVVHRPPSTTPSPHRTICPYL